MNERLLIKTEIEIRVGIHSIQNGIKTPKDAGVGKMLNAMKILDNPLYLELMEKYKKALKSQS